MTNKNSLLDHIDVREPCAESWEEMTGNDEVRFCSHCSKNVFDLSSYTRERAEKLVRDANGGICVRYRKDERGRVVTAPPRFTQIKRHAKIAAGVLATTMSVASMAYTQGSPRLPNGKPAFEKREKDKDPNALTGFVVSGAVTDALGALIPGANVSISTPSGHFKGTTRTDNDGIYEFENIEPGLYNLEIESPGFKKATLKGMSVDANHRWDVSLDVGEIMGVVVMAGEPIVCDDPPKMSNEVELPKLIEPLRQPTFVLGLFPGVKMPEDKAPAEKSKRKLPK